MTSLCCKVLKHLQGKTLVTAESLTCGGIGAALTAIPGSSAIYKGGIICYTNEVKQHILGVEPQVLSQFGAVSAQTAAQMAAGARVRLNADIAVAVTGLAGPGGDDCGNPVGTVCIGFSDEHESFAVKHHFNGDRDEVRSQTIRAALELVLDNHS
jgi:nicotinamide-nucleotide amidase